MRLVEDDRLVGGRSEADAHLLASPSGHLQIGFLCLELNLIELSVYGYECVSSVSI